jgi:predicted dehydrogenase
MAETLKWGIISTGRIAQTFANGLQHTDTGELVAVGSRTKEAAEKFGKEFGIEKCCGSYEELLADKDVEAVYIATPHPMHAEWAIKAAQAGKHILCEKPLGINHAEAMAVVEAAHRNDVFLMEAFMYRCHPQIAKLVDMIKEKAIGEVRLIVAPFSFHAGFNPDSRLFSQKLAGGGILDVGCYSASMSRLIAGASMGKDFADPVGIKASGHLGETGVDEYTAGLLTFENGIIAQISTGVSLSQDNVVRIYGTEGSIIVRDPWIPAREGGETILELKKGGDSETITVKTDRWLYSLEADMVANNIENRQGVSPAMTWKDTLGNMKTLDMWREQIGLVYDMEKPDAEEMKVPVHKGPLKVCDNNIMTYGELKGLDKKISRLVMGVDYQNSIVHASVILDDYFERGGNTIDTAYIYGGGNSEKILGQWIKNRGIRDEIVILDKGGHTPYCYPEAVKKEIETSLERMQTDYTDIYMLHRDNVEVPVEEFIDMFNEFIDQGKVKVFGGSNWSYQRIEEANTYADKNGKQGFSAVSKGMHCCF